MKDYNYVLAIVLVLFKIFTTIKSNYIPIQHPVPIRQQTIQESLKDSELNDYQFKGIDKIIPPSIPISECMFVTSETGRFTYESTSDDPTVCGAYFITDPDKRVELFFLSFDVPCEGGGLVSFVDGWELNGEFFPSPEDHSLPLEERVTEFCGKYVSHTFISSQNGAVIQYRIPFKGKGFTVIARYRRNPTPCNVLVNSTMDSFTLRNYGKRINCTLLAIYPSVVQTIDLNVGGRRLEKSLLPYMRHFFLEKTGTIHQCNKLGLADHVLIGGNTGLDTSKIEVLDSICGSNNKPDSSSQIIGCEVTTVKLVSSGFTDNSVTVFIRPAVEEEILNSNLICGF
ncbi:corticotropin-releasing factor-binding protein [Chelonus insularis]|uniref:corticotropin-releasing factor-binding protein n=1 Tax=Chelonus insularis TaxID=460826 RepID=UPI00158A209F|nr:corticotropin-releasing factor-binding protein [Chelonus insularis]